MAESFDGLIVEVDAVHHHVGGQGGRVHSEAVILGGDFNFAGFQVLDGLVGAAMAEFELEGFAAEGLAENLMSKAYSKDRDAVVDKIAARPGRRSRELPGRQARWKGRFPAGLYASASAAVAVAGTTCTRKPCWRRRRRMLYFIPKSKATMGRSAGGMEGGFMSLLAPQREFEGGA